MMRPMVSTSAGSASRTSGVMMQPGSLRWSGVASGSGGGGSESSGGGSAPARLRNAFLELIENDARGEHACRLAEQLSDCTDVLPFEHCEILELPAGSTFA